MASADAAKPASPPAADPPADDPMDADPAPPAVEEKEKEEEATPQKQPEKKRGGRRKKGEAAAAEKKTPPSKKSAGPTAERPSRERKTVERYAELAPRATPAKKSPAIVQVSRQRLLSLSLPLVRVAPAPDLLFSPRRPSQLLPYLLAC
jgi:protein DEK